MFSVFVAAPGGEVYRLDLDDSDDEPFAQRAFSDWNCIILVLPSDAQFYDPKM